MLTQTNLDWLRQDGRDVVSWAHYRTVLLDPTIWFTEF